MRLDWNSLCFFFSGDVFLGFEICGFERLMGGLGDAAVLSVSVVLAWIR